MNLHNTSLREKRLEQNRKARDRAEKDRKEKEEKDKKKKPDSPADKYGKNMCKYAWRGNLKRVQRCIRKGGSVEYVSCFALLSSSPLTLVLHQVTSRCCSLYSLALLSI